MKQLKKLLFPHGFVVFLLFNLTIVLLVYSLGYPEAIPVIQYISYAISAYALVVVCFRIPGIIRWWKNILYGNKLTAKYLTEKHVRDMVSLYTGIGMHFMLLKKEWVREENEVYELEQEDLKRVYQLRSHRFCGNLMFFLNVAMCGMLVQMIWQGEGYTYPGTMVYAFAAYAFYCLISAVIKWVKYRNNANPIFSASKNIKLAKALMSLFTLQTVLLNQFGAETAVHAKRVMNLLTGSLVCAAVFALAVLMVVKSTEEIRKIKKGV